MEDNTYYRDYNDVDNSSDKDENLFIRIYLLFIINKENYYFWSFTLKKNGRIF